jgi:hypothetical protein
MPNVLAPSRLKPASIPRPPSCPKCAAKMVLLNVDPHGSRYMNLDLWLYRCDACGEGASNYVAHGRRLYADKQSLVDRI